MDVPSCLVAPFYGLRPRWATTLTLKSLGEYPAPLSAYRLTGGVRPRHRAGEPADGNRAGLSGTGDCEANCAGLRRGGMRLGLDLWEVYG